LNNYRTVLVVEDNPGEFLLLKRAMAKIGFKAPIQHVIDGEQAISYLDGSGPFEDRTKFPIPSLVLLDLKLPRRTGFEVLSWVRQHSRYKKLPVVIFTSSDQREDIDRAYNSGVNSYLVKPADFEGLMKVTDSINGYWMGLNRSPEL
jgi:CheY-like chemotaxis protein